jgi:hypothetical protein
MIKPVSENWIKFIEFCEQNPYCTIKNVDVVNGNPVYAKIEKEITESTVAIVKLKFN